MSDNTFARINELIAQIDEMGLGRDDVRAMLDRHARSDREDSQIIARAASYWLARHRAAADRGA